MYALIIGTFYQSPEVHRRSKGCRRCSREIFINNWSFSDWEKKAKQSSHFESYKVYVIKCFNENEEFIKIGRTFNAIERRFRANSLKAYKYELLKEFIFDKPRECCEFEIFLHNKFKKYEYLPHEDFNGKYECFKCSTSILEWLNNFD